MVGRVARGGRWNQSAAGLAGQRASGEVAPPPLVCGRGAVGRRAGVARFALSALGIGESHRQNVQKAFERQKLVDQPVLNV